MREYSNSETLIANLPYAIMVALGSLVLLLAMQVSGPMPAWFAAGGYFAYGVSGALWIMVFICPYCAFHGARGCPCGYGLLSARVVPKDANECFAKQFKKHVPVIVPLWFVPPLLGGIAMLRNFTWLMPALLSVFIINSFVILPLVSRRHGCVDCHQKDICPWMADGAKD